MPATAKGTQLASPMDRPLSGLFAIAKPSGPTSMELLENLKRLFASSSLFYAHDAPAPFSSAAKKIKRPKPWEKALLAKCGRLPPKIGQGGTLDPLAEGVLGRSFGTDPVVGVGTATKELQQFLHCTKDYRVTGLFGTATSSYDSKDPVVSHAPFAHIDQELLREKLALFKGDIQQIPPLYSALRMDGKRLFEYAREKLPLPRPIEARSVTVSEICLADWLPGGQHEYRAPEMEVSDDEKAIYQRMQEMTKDSNAASSTQAATATLASEKNTEDKASELESDTQESDGSKQIASQAAEPTAQDTSANSTQRNGQPAAFVLEMTVSSGTYVRSIVHDLGIACNSAAHVVRLIRTRQGAFSLGHNHVSDGASVVDGQVSLPGNCIPWEVFERGLAELDINPPAQAEPGKNDKLREWEQVLLSRIQAV
ncbi:tRNA pseudouridine(55) synthase [Malassezia psittaci]|uniref:tRNA pseudouridine(55) synthase n=1 Tax=Malassezia psittaci TaxID=1821823 RepID=A0AAF0FFM3_9BASI|nr:tRNA pseudouridine(55) synthase [Malassezia psittaci]